MPVKSSPPPVPARFRVAKATLLMDRFMNEFIKIGGLSVIVAVFGIFVFILVQILPLFRGAEAGELKAIAIEPGEYLDLGIDEWSELPFALQGDGDLLFIDVVGDRGVMTKSIPFAAEHGVGAVRYNQLNQRLTVGTKDGQFALVDIEYKPVYGADNTRTIEAELNAGELLPIGRPGVPVAMIGYADAGVRKLVVAKQIVDGRMELHAVTLAQRRTLMGGGRVTVDQSYDLTPLIAGTIDQFLVASQADSVLIATTEGELIYLFLDGGQFYVRQRIKPFAHLSDPRIAHLRYVFGDVTFVAVAGNGETKGYSLYLDPAVGSRQFGETKHFASQPGATSVSAASVRNKAFLLGTERHARLIFSTTETVRWQKNLDFTIRHAVIGGKYDRMVFLDDQSKLHLYWLRDPHPESSFRAFFGKLWYEGASEPKFDWQSTGGSDDFEPKLSLIPLIIGSLKGTLYALLFAVPIALLAATYTSQFLRPGVKTIVKPTMEIMASLPSVVLGFLAALWLAPILETRVPSILLIVTLVPLSALVFGWGWARLPPRIRLFIPPGWEFIVFFPIMFITGYLAWQLGPALERMVFVVSDPSTGVRIADFRLWWPSVTGTPFEQRNSLVVGFMMGFAVIPIIFTIAEDALSNVPQALRSGSLALGASRWQTAFRIVLPTASAGIFSALMIGLGRAVGETMIVVMATGNTPIMEWNIFSGMRTLAANIAVELPEAPHHGTLYRSLFLGAMMLFLMTFLVNTVAEVLRQRLRDRYKTVE
ncbi:MAG: ABC transporter permease subunit [Candidatus Didemnitutus sp.]|nr:ABC transporter permease subunit [Candidatus Didemnitutus sp.]